MAFSVLSTRVISGFEDLIPNRHTLKEAIWMEATEGATSKERTTELGGRRKMAHVGC